MVAFKKKNTEIHKIEEDGSPPLSPPSGVQGQRPDGGLEALP